MIDTPTWRASLDWGARLGYDPIRLAAINRRAVEFVTALADERPNLQRIVNGVIGPRGDGYVVGATMSASEAAAYHGLQARAFAEAGAEMISAITMTYAEEAIGIARAAGSVSLPVVISLTVETDGRMPSGQTLADAIAQIDAATTTPPAYYMVNCAHPTHFIDRLDPTADWVGRIQGVRANASTMSHAELDAATELDRGDIGLLADNYAQLATVLDLRVIGGCCGTDHEHVGTVYDRLVTEPRRVATPSAASGGRAPPWVAAGQAEEPVEGRSVRRDRDGGAEQTAVARCVERRDERDRGVDLVGGWVVRLTGRDRQVPAVDHELVECHHADHLGGHVHATDPGAPLPCVLDRPGLGQYVEVGGETVAPPHLEVACVERRPGASRWLRRVPCGRPWRSSRRTSRGGRRGRRRWPSRTAWAA